ncbi:MAG: FKBP-type peptidyl-prolyl cis-trans isomerase [Micrococcaceae bacterium]
MALNRPRTRRRLTAAVGTTLTALLLLTACSSPQGTGDVDALGVVDFSVNDEGSPEVSLDGEIEAGETSSRVLHEGDGEHIENGEIALVSTALVDSATGEVSAENFTASAEAVIVNDALEESNDVLYSILTDYPIGTQIAYFVTSGTPEGEEGEEGEEVTAANSQLMVFEIMGKRPTHADGEEVPAEELDDTLPSVTRDEETGEPTIETPEGDAPTELVTDVLLQGDGDTVESEDFVTVQYRGVSWSDGTEFDSSWSRGEPYPASLSQMIPGWRDGLTGQQVGSQVLISVPPAEAYGELDEDAEEGSQHELAGETLVFVVDILHTQHPMSAATEDDTESLDEATDETTEEN